MRKLKEKLFYFLTGSIVSASAIFLYLTFFASEQEFSLRPVELVRKNSELLELERNLIKRQSQIAAERQEFLSFRLAAMRGFGFNTPEDISEVDRLRLEQNYIREALLNSALQSRKRIEELEARLENSASELSLIRVNFATNRRQKLPVSHSGAIEFGGERGDLAWGEAIISVPHERDIGELNSPGWLVAKIWGADPTKHIVSQSTRLMSRDEIVALMKSNSSGINSSTLLFVHGYNTSFEDALRRTAQITHDIEFSGNSLVFSWPSAAKKRAYPVDKANAEWSVTHLTSVLTTLLENEVSNDVVVIAHSMGSYVLTQALSRIATLRPDFRERIRTIILAAPDIDAEVFKRDIAPKITTEDQPITVYASSKDNALKASREFNGYPRLGDIAEVGRPILGVDLIDASKVETGFWGHTYFGDNASVIADIYYLIRGKMNPSERFLERVETQQGSWWAFKTK
ncbi:MAG: alpha/beta hydrolase [Pseudomonadota bacterium]